MSKQIINIELDGKIIGSKPLTLNDSLASIREKINNKVNCPFIFLDKSSKKMIKENESELKLKDIINEKKIQIESFKPGINCLLNDKIIDSIECSKNKNLDDVRKMINDKIKGDFVFLDSNDNTIDIEDEQDYLIEDILKNDEIKLNLKDNISNSTSSNSDEDSKEILTKEKENKNKDIDFSKYEVLEKKEPSGGSPTYDLPNETSPSCADNIETYSMGFWKYFLSKIAHDEKLGIFSIVRFLGFHYDDENYTSCHTYDSTYPEGVHYVYNEDPRVDYNMYFDFLKTTTYFDNKANLQYFFDDVLLLADVDCLKNDVCENSLEAKGEEEYAKYQEMLEYDRQKIIYNILEILDAYDIGIQYGSYYPKSDLIPGNHEYTRKAYYWPIGSDEITEKNGVLFADGDPASTSVKSYFGERTNEVTGKKEMHYGIDISGTEGTTNVIAVEKGEVISVVDSCSAGDYECNEGYGNTIIISHPDGNYTVYASLASVDTAVTVGSTVLKGQLIGKVGQTGRTKSADLHFEIRQGGNSTVNAIDPVSLISSSEPRPTGYGGGDFSMHSTSLTKEEFVNGLKDYCSRTGCSGSMAFFAQNGETIYDVSMANGLNPEFTVVRAINEGFSPGSSRNNYWGIGCTNTGGLAACKSYGSFSAGIKGLATLGIVQKYDSALEVFTKGHYAYIGSNWYNPGSSSSGGCYYFPYIKEYYTDTGRIPTVENACAAGRTCSGGSCIPTNDADQEAYGYYQIRTMTKSRYNIWGLS